MEGKQNSKSSFFLHFIICPLQDDEEHKSNSQGTAYFQKWEKAFTNQNILFCAVCLPGRLNRASEECATSIKDISIAIFLALKSMNMIKTMLNLIENLPVELVGTNILGYLDIRDIVMLERACSCKESHQLFRFWIQSCPSVVIPSSKYKNIKTLIWFAKREGRIEFLTIELPGDNPGLQVENLQVDYFNLQLFRSADSF